MTKCVVSDCDNDSKGGFGYCRKHYQQFYKDHPEYKPRGKYGRNHPLYIIWWQRKSDKLLCEEWLNFDKFVDDVSPKPDGNFLLVRLRNDLFGPTNFKWQEHLKRKEDESKKDWHARKRAARIAANPSMESDRNLKRIFGITREKYNENLQLQNFVCAICEQPETTVSPNTGTIKQLAVDHCHKTNKVRELLCYRCNTTIGRINENIELLDKMKAYLIKHLD
jgi:hypothetical protein